MCVIYVCTARLRIIGIGGMHSEVRLRSDVNDAYLCFDQRGKLIVKVNIKLPPSTVKIYYFFPWHIFLGKFTFPSLLLSFLSVIVRAMLSGNKSLMVIMMIDKFIFQLA